MKPELLAAWRNLENSIDGVLAAKPIDLSKAATELARSRDAYEQALLVENTVESPARGLVSGIKAKARNLWERFKHYLKEAEVRGKKSLLRVVYNVCVLVVLCYFLFDALYGSAVSLGYLVTAFGLILVALSQLLPKKYLQDLATLAGIALVGWWYVHTLPGVFNPVQKLLLDSDPLTSGYHVIVGVDDNGKEACDFSSDSSTLSCKVRIAQAVLAPHKE